MTELSTIPRLALMLENKSEKTRYFVFLAMRRKSQNKFKSLPCIHNCNSEPAELTKQGSRQFDCQQVFF